MPSADSCHTVLPDSKRFSKFSPVEALSWRLQFVATRLTTSKVLLQISFSWSHKKSIQAQDTSGNRARHRLRSSTT